MMENQNTELKENLAALKMLVDSYDTTSNYLGIASAIAFFIIGAIVVMAIGELFGIILIVIGFAPLLFCKNSNNANEKELSEQACILMSTCINLHKTSAPIHAKVLTYGLNGNLPLYEEFISLFPQMSSSKLRKLAAVKIGL